MKHCLSNFLYSVRNESSESLDIYIDGYIVDAPTQELLRRWYDDETSVSYKSLRDQINAIQPKTINIYINSGGGQVADALAIHDMIVDLQNKGVTVNTEGRGIIASAATYILMASKNSSISKNSWFMIHNVQGGVYGDVNEVENAAAMMRRFNNQIRDLYVEHTGKDASTISQWMNKETWFSGSEAVEKGFVKNVTGEVSFTNSIEDTKWPFANTAVLNAYNQSIKTFNTDTMDLKNLQQTIENGFNSLLEKLGVGNKAGEESVKNALTEFSTSIVNAVQEAVPSEEKLSEMVTNAVAESLKNIDVTETEAFKTALQNAVTEATKDISKPDLTNLVNKESLEKELKDAKTEIVNAVAEKLGGKGSGQRQENKDKNQTRRTPANRFSGQYENPDEA